MDKEHFLPELRVGSCELRSYNDYTREPYLIDYINLNSQLSALNSFSLI